MDMSFLDFLHDGGATCRATLTSMVKTDWTGLKHEHVSSGGPVQKTTGSGMEVGGGLQIKACKPCRQLPIHAARTC